MTWLFANIIPAVVIWGAMSGIPLWLVLRRRYAADAPPQPVAAQARVGWPADRPLAAEREMAAAQRELTRAQRDRVPVRVPVPTAR